MNHHIGDTNEMSETPISDSTPHNVADLGMQIRRLERQLNAANQRIKRLEADYQHALDCGGLALAYAEKGDYESANEVWRRTEEAKL